jgi:hypothetical protein
MYYSQCRKNWDLKNILKKDYNFLQIFFLCLSCPTVYSLTLRSANNFILGPRGPALSSGRQRSPEGGHHIAAGHVMLCHVMSANIKLVKLPGNSSDLHPIENVCGWMKMKQKESTGGSGRVSLLSSGLWRQRPTGEAGGLHDQETGWGYCVGWADYQHVEILSRPRKCVPDRRTLI